MRFRKEQHLTHDRAFKKVRDLGSMSDCGAFILRVYVRGEGESPPCPRLGVIASRRVGNAVARNRAKRLFRELFRQNQHLLPERADVLLIARASMAHKNLASLLPRYQKALGYCLSKQTL